MERIGVPGARFAVNITPATGGFLLIALVGACELAGIKHTHTRRRDIELIPRGSQVAGSLTFTLRCRQREQPVLKRPGKTILQGPW